MKLIEEYQDHQEIYNKGYRFNPDEDVFFTENVGTFVYPEGEKYKNWSVKPIDKNAYLNERMKEMGIKEADNHFELIDQNNEKSTTPIFTANKHGDIEILQYGLNRKIHTYEVKSTSAGTVLEWCVQKRLNPNITPFTEGKYDFKEAINTPFWHPNLIQAFEEKEAIPTLVITEGQFKAFKACHEGIPTVGLTSISHFRDKKLKSIHPEIIDFIRACGVENIIILWDGDSRNISQKDIENGNDLTNRPGQFFGYARAIKKLIQKFFPPKKLTIYFSTINTDDIPTAPKGIDDLLSVPKISTADVVDDFQKIGMRPGFYISWINITGENGEKELRKWFNLAYVSDFYQYHKERIKLNNFVYYGTTYKIEKDIPVQEVSKDLKEFKLIGNGFYRLMDCTVVIGKNGETGLEKRLIPFKPEIIKLLHGKDALHKIEVFKGFTNVPNHVEYKQIINGEWNLYFDVQHETRDGDFPTISKLLKHVFQEHYDNEMILDYITVLYRYPMQKLPIICLLSEEQGTGKSTFLFLMKLIFKQNMAIISNAEITGEFNSHWTSKLIAACEETIFEKKDAYEKLKAYSTQKTLQMHEKNKTPYEIPCMLHFILCSNHERDFMKISRYDRRLWVRKVHPFKKKEEDADVNFDQKLEDEVPAFVNFIQNREVKYKEKGALYFHEADFQTSAFQTLVENSEPGVIKDLRMKIQEYFERYNCTELNIGIKDLKRHFDINVGANSDKWFSEQIVTLLKAKRCEMPTTYSFLVYDPNSLDFSRLERAKGRYFTFQAADFGSVPQTNPIQLEITEEDCPY